MCRAGQGPTCRPGAPSVLNRWAPSSWHRHQQPAPAASSGPCVVGCPLSAPHAPTLICSEKARPASRHAFGGLSPLLCAQPRPCVPWEAWPREAHTHCHVSHPRTRLPPSFCAVGQGPWNGVGGPSGSRTLCGAWPRCWLTFLSKPGSPGVAPHTWAAGAEPGRSQSSRGSPGTPQLRRLGAPLWNGPQSHWVSHAA